MTAKYFIHLSKSCMKQLSKASKGPAFGGYLLHDILNVLKSALFESIFLQGVQKCQLVQGQVHRWVCHNLTGSTSLLWQNEQANCCAKEPIALLSNLRPHPRKITSMTLQYLYVEVTVHCCSFWHILCLYRTKNLSSFWSSTLANETFWVLPMLFSSPVLTNCDWVPLFPICETVWSNIIQIFLFPKSEWRI